VEPNVPFWAQFLKMAKFTVSVLEGLTIPGVDPKKEKSYWSSEANQVAIRAFTPFVGVLENLLQIAQKQAANEPLASEDVSFLKNVIEETHGSGATKYMGWYPSLFYPERESAGKWDPLIADVHTDAPDDIVGDAGCVLHEAVGNVHTMLVAFDRGNDVVCYAGPVSSHYEFLCPINERKSDAEWREILRKQPPPHPKWTESFLVPGVNPAAAKYVHSDERSANNYFSD
jgi:hypothetical protein